MPNLVAEWLFLLAFWLPPAVVVVAAAALLVPERAAPATAARPEGAAAVL